MSNWWHVVWGTARAEFSDLGSAADVTQVLMRLGLALILGGILGFEREMSRRDAGMRTHMMVSVGAALFVVVPLQAGFSQDNMSRVLQGLVSGVGFLGAGVIVHAEPQHKVRGLTSAACVWFAACIGVICGAGQWRLVTVGLAMALLLLIAGGPLERLLHRLLTADDKPA